MCARACVRVSVSECVRACVRERVPECALVCVFSFKRRKTTVVTERSRKISYQIAEPTLGAKGLKSGQRRQSTITTFIPTLPARSKSKSAL